VSFAGLFDINFTDRKASDGREHLPDKAGTLSGPAFGALEIMKISSFGTIHGNVTFGIWAAGAPIAR
jgi:hypothetical protein